MASYIGKVQISGGNPVLIGSTLYGVCYTAANVSIKDITPNTNGSGNPITEEYVNTNYDQLIRGTTIHIKFINGNTATSNLQLQVGSTGFVDVIGQFSCPPNTVISFTLDENIPPNWVVNDNVDTTYNFAEGTTNGTISVTPSGGTAQSVSVHGLGDSAYKGVITNIANNSSSTDVPTTQAVVSYVQDMTGGLSGLSGAMHFRGSVTANGVTITDGGTEMPHIDGYDYQDGNPKSNFSPEPGDVILFEQKEFVWSNSAWELLGDESSYALKSSTDTVTEIGNITPGTLPALTITQTDVSEVSVTTQGTAATLTRDPKSIPNVTSAGSATTASVSAGVLNITIGAAPTIANDPITFDAIGTWTSNTPTVISSTSKKVGSASGWDQGSMPVITPNDVTVVVPNTVNP